MVYSIFIFIVATAIGYKVISDVPGMLHTPLMSGMNALSGITLLGALVATSVSIQLKSELLGAIAIIMAMINIVAGFFITHRMLKMFKDKNPGDTKR